MGNQITNQKSDIEPLSKAAMDKLLRRIKWTPVLFSIFGFTLILLAWVMTIILLVV